MPKVPSNLRAGEGYGIESLVLWKTPETQAALSTQGQALCASVSLSKVSTVLLFYRTVTAYQVPFEAFVAYIKPFNPNKTSRMQERGAALHNGRKPRYSV